MSLGVKFINIILAEDINYPFVSFVSKAKEKFPASCTLSMNRNNMEEVRKIVKLPPPIFEGWLVVVSMYNITNELIQSLNNPRNIVIYTVRNKESMSELRRKFEVLDIDHKVVNNLNIDNEKVIDYVMRELGIGYEIAKYICDRHSFDRRSKAGYYVPKVMESVERLRLVPKITRDSVKKYTTSRNEVGFDALFDFIIGLRPDIKYNKIVELVHKYRYGLDFVFKYLLKKFETYLFVYDKIIIGKVSLDNFKSYYEANKGDMEGISEYQFKKAVDSFSKVSFDKLYYLYVLYSREQQSATALLTLLKLSK